uniref:hypothetical protein n=1 Tax=Rudaea sp. TaxID=2136325 RepID=UPI00321FB353
VLAQLFRVDPQTLRFGGKGHLQVNDQRFMWPERVSPRDQALFEDFLLLPAKQREAVRALIESLTLEQQKK